jgi:hypothetical protein
MDWLFFWNKKQTNRNNQTANTAEGEELIEQIEKAKNEWIHTRLSFDWADHPEAIDYAVYSIEAAERRYMFLLNEAKKLGIVAKPTF